MVREHWIFGEMLTEGAKCWQFEYNNLLYGNAMRRVIPYIITHNYSLTYILPYFLQ